MLDRLSEHWRRLGAPIAESLRPGLSVAEIDALVAPLGFRLPSEASVWWGWHDGTESARLSHALGNGIVALQLEQAVARHRENRRIAEELIRDRLTPDAAENYWPPHWLTVGVAAGLGEVVCDCSVAEDEPTPIRLSDFEYPEESQIPLAPSLGTLVGWWLDALDSGAWSYDLASRSWRDHPERLAEPQGRSRLLVVGLP
jgi:cell wall assembly regulator SMI1